MAITVSSTDDAAAALAEAASATATTVLDVMTDSAAYPPITMYEGKIANPLAPSKDRP